jgi:voltage-gated potassium channel
VGGGRRGDLAERGGDGSIQTFADALWWAAATITTVGYGDVYPRTAAGRGVAVVLMLIGISLFGLLTARVAAFFVETDDTAQNARYDEILRRLDRMEAASAPRPDLASEADAQFER